MTVSAFDGVDKKAARAQPARDHQEERRPQQLRPDHRPSTRRRQQAQVPHHRLPPRQAGDARAVVQRLEYDPNRSAFIALVKYEDGELRYILAPVGLKPGDTILALRFRGYQARQLPAGRQHPQAHHPQHRALSGRGAQLVRSALHVRAADGKDAELAQVRLPSGEVRLRPYELQPGQSSARLATSTTRTCTLARPAVPVTWASA